MKIFRSIAFAILIGAFSCVEAATVQWDFINARGGYTNSDTYSSELWASFGAFQVSLYCGTTSVGGGNYELSNFMCNLMTSITWTQVAMGDVISASMFGNGKTSIYSTQYDGATDRLIVQPGEMVYLAFEANDLVWVPDEEYGYYESGASHYGFVAINPLDDGRLDFIDSAIELSDSFITVSERPSSGVIPEPTSGLMLLVGLSVLALRRR